MKTNIILNGDCLEQLKTLPDNLVDAIITDPPYGIGFMGKEWDNFKPSNIQEAMEKDKRPKTQIASTRTSNTAGTYDLSQSANLKFQLWFSEIAKECLRVLKPGGYLLSFGGTRTYHRMTCGIEDAGFEIRDCIMWIYGSGFPKSLNIGKQIDKMNNVKREVIEVKDNPKKEMDMHYPNDDGGWLSNENFEVTKGSSEWEGWGTALKPAVEPIEPIVVARKPLSEKNVALNVLKWGTGGINIDESRIGTNAGWNYPNGAGGNTFHGQDRINYPIKSERGRFPANIIFDEESAKLLNEQSGETSKGHFPRDNTKGTSIFNTQNLQQEEKWLNDKGGASRFFYCAKASKSERNFGCDELPDKDRKEEWGDKFGAVDRRLESKDKSTGTFKNFHPTVKPIKLMEYLIKLVSKEGAIILDPFLGSGTTAIACIKTNRKFIGIEKEADYIKIAEARLKPYLEQEKL